MFKFWHVKEMPPFTALVNKLDKQFHLAPLDVSPHPSLLLLLDLKQTVQQVR